MRHFSPDYFIKLYLILKHSFTLPRVDSGCFYQIEANLSVHFSLKNLFL